jgi:hypothetical protein
MAYALLAIAPALMLMILAGSFLIFFVLPRISSRYLSAYTPTSDVSTGFSDRVQLGRIGQIQQSSAAVMHIEIQNDVQGGYDLKWRGIALSNFDGRVWSNAYEQPRRHGGRRPLSAGSVAGPAQAPAAAGRSIHYRVMMEPLGTNVFFLAERPQSLTGNFRQVSVDAGGAVYDLDPEHPINRYEAESQLAETDSDELRLAANTAPRRDGAVSETAAARCSHFEAGRGNHRAGSQQLRQGSRAGAVSIHPLRIHAGTAPHSAARIHWRISCSKERKVTASISPVRWR